MKTGMGLAAGLAAGYLLGRRKKFRTLLLAGTVLATGQAGRLGSDALKRTLGAGGSDSAMSKLSPELGKLSGVITDQLAGAGKAAAMAAVTNRVDSLADSIHDRAEGLRSGGQEAASRNGGQQRSPAERTTGGSDQRPRKRQDGKSQRRSEDDR